MDDIEYVLTHPRFWLLECTTKVFSVCVKPLSYPAQSPIGESTDYREAFAMARRWLEENGK